MSQQAKALEKAGWRLHRTVKHGMVKQAWWVDPVPIHPGTNNHSIQPQAYAYAIMRQRKLYVKTGSEVAVSAGSPKPMSAGSTPAAPAKDLE